MSQPLLHESLFPILLLDASATKVCVGVLEGHRWLAFAESESQALESLFDLVVQVLNKAELNLGAIRGFLFCEGPGSVLGIRLVAMAIRTWRAFPEHAHKPVLAYRSLLAAEAMLAAEKKLQAPYTIITESRMKKWNILQNGDGVSENEIREVTDRDLSDMSETHYYFNQRAGGKPPSNVIKFNYDLKVHPAIFSNLLSLRMVAEPDAWLPENTIYQKWSAQRHGATGEAVVDTRSI